MFAQSRWLFIFSSIIFLNYGPLKLSSDEFPFEPPKNFTLNPKYIAVHHPVTTSLAAAQLYFDQGLTFIYAFNHDAAYWSFLRAAELDPQLAMAYWGMALAQGSNINMNITSVRKKTAYEAVAKAAQLAANASESERDYIMALSQRYSNDPKTESQQLAAQYGKAMKALTEKYPDDLDASVLYAESLLDISPWNQWNADGTPMPGTKEALDTLESVIKREPNNLGANHYFIHVIESSLNPERGLMSAERLKTLLPSSGHILHMPSHIYLLVGDYHQAALSNEQAIAADREYIREYGDRGIYPIHYMSHNLYFLSRAYSMEGRYVDAKRAADQLTALYAPHVHRMPELEYYYPTSMFILLRFHKWEDILKLPEPSQEMQVTHVLWHFGKGMAFASLGNVKKASDERLLFLKEKSKLTPDLVFGYNKADKIMEIAEAQLDAKLSEAQGNISASIESLQKAVAEQDTLHYNEPPDWFFPLRESLGGLLLRDGRYSDAERVFREDLKRHPRNGRSLFGLKESLTGQTGQHDLYWVEKEFQKAWMYSDIQLNIKEL